jgi:hypothetical protein
MKKLKSDSSFSFELVMHVESISTTSSGSLFYVCLASDLWVYRDEGGSTECIRTRNLSRLEAADLRFSPRGH